MNKTFTLALGLGLAFWSPAMAETYLNPDRPWWGTFFQAVDGVTPDYEALARRDPAYLSAGEFDRAAVLQEVIARLQGEQADIDVANAVVTISIRANLGDYSVENSGFPVSIFSQNMHLKYDFNQLFFRNWSDFNIFPATTEEGRALRERIGQQAVAAEVTMSNFQKSTTRPNAYDGFVTKVAYFAQDGLPLAEFTATEDAPLSDEVAADLVTAARARIVEASGIPALGTSWIEAKDLLSEAYPYVASDDFAYTSSGKMVAYRYDAGQVVTDEAHIADRPFRVFLQQVDGPWRTTSGFSSDSVMAGMNSAYSVDIKGTGPGLACYTPETHDRCAVLEFSPSDGGHVLTRAYGIIEMERTNSAQAAVEAFIGSDAAEAFDGFSTKLGYDPKEVKQGIAVQFGGDGGVASYAAGAGATKDVTPFYDPLENTRGVNAINREIAIFAVEGAEARMPIIFVLQ
ncbi:hypothetical protein [Roseovarius mucosus]|uniref:hypothetical protein n=1 Tax=Roseovarius mucosus TaxID=215743 RepID=UPI003BAA42F4